MTVCHACGAPIDSRGQHRDVDADQRRQLDTTARELMKRDKSLTYGDACRQALRDRDQQAEQAAAAIRSGVNPAQVLRERELIARAERVQRERGLCFSDAMKLVIGDPAMRRLVDSYRRG